MKWNIESINDTVKWLREHRHTIMDVDVFCEMKDEFIKQMMSDKDDYLILKLAYGIERYKWGGVHHTMDFPLSEIVDAIHSFVSTLKDAIIQDAEFSDDRWRDSLLKYIDAWDSDFDIHSEYIYESLSSFSNIIRIRMAERKAKIRSEKRKKSFCSDICLNNYDLYNGLIAEMNGCDTIQKKIEALAKFRVRNKDKLNLKGVNGKDITKKEMYKYVRADSNMRIDCEESTFIRYYDAWDFTVINKI